MVIRSFLVQVRIIDLSSNAHHSRNSRRYSEKVAKAAQKVSLARSCPPFIPISHSQKLISSDKQWRQAIEELGQGEALSRDDGALSCG
jgi:hypothetical protein